MVKSYYNVTTNQQFPQYRCAGDNLRYLDISFLCTFVLGSENSREGLQNRYTHKIFSMNILVIWHTKKGRKNFWGMACGKRGIALFGVTSMECCNKRLNDVIVFCASFTVHHNLLRNPPRLPATRDVKRSSNIRNSVKIFGFEFVFCPFDIRF